MNTTTLDTATTEFVITRDFDAPRDLVWKAWTEQERLAKWWGPKGYGITVVKLDFQPGGIFHYRMDTPSGDPMWGRFVYGELTPPQRLEFVDSFADEDANIARAPFSELYPLKISNILTLTEQDGKTTLDLRGNPLDATEEEREFFRSMHASMQQGFGGTFEQLADYLAQAQSA